MSYDLEHNQTFIIERSSSTCLRPECCFLTLITCTVVTHCCTCVPAGWEQWRWNGHGWHAKQHVHAADAI